MNKVFALLVLLIPAGCSSFGTDPATNYRLPYARTQIDFQPPDRDERIRQIERERVIFEKKEQELKNALETLAAEREILYGELSHEFPDCHRQRHCLAARATGARKRFERFDEIRTKFNEMDRRGITLEADLKDWRYRYDLRVRAIYNRYLVHEMLETKNWNNDIRQILVHSLETFPNRRALSSRLLQIADPGLVPTLVGDLDFRMLAKPVDAAALLATFDIWLHEDLRRANEPVRFMVTFLVNTHQLDPQFYEAEFLKEWARRFSDNGRELLRGDAFCGIYSIANPILVPKLDPSKVKPCAVYRERAGGFNAEIFDQRFPPSLWLLPVAYSPVFEEKDLR